MNCTPKGFKVSNEDIITAANNAIAHVEKKRKELYEARIADIMSGFFGFFKSTREEAEKIIESDIPFADWRIQGWGKTSWAEEMLGAVAVNQEDFAWLSSDDASTVKSWLN